MTRVSKRYLQKNIEKRMFQIFWQSFIDLKSEKDTIEFCQDLLSEAEKVMLAKRLAIVVLLEKGWKYEDISRILKVSTSTINAVRVKLSYLGQGYRKAVNNILKREEISSFFANLSNSLATIAYPIKGRGISGFIRKTSYSYKKSNQQNKNML